MNESDSVLACSCSLTLGSGPRERAKRENAHRMLGDFTGTRLFGPRYSHYNYKIKGKERCYTFDEHFIWYLPAAVSSG